MSEVSKFTTSNATTEVQGEEQQPPNRIHSLDDIIEVVDHQTQDIGNDL